MMKSPLIGKERPLGNDMKKVKAGPKTKPAPKVSVSELNVRKAAARLLKVKLVSTEIAYLQRTLGASATQEQIDEQVLRVRSMPWSAIAIPD